MNFTTKTCSWSCSGYIQNIPKSLKWCLERHVTCENTERITGGSQAQNHVSSTDWKNCVLANSLLKLFSTNPLALGKVKRCPIVPGFFVWQRLANPLLPSNKSCASRFDYPSYFTLLDLSFPTFMLCMSVFFCLYDLILHFSNWKIELQNLPYCSS